MKKYFSVLVVAFLLFSFLGIIVLGNETHAEQRGVRIPVVMYHHLAEKAENSMTVTPQKFKEDLLAYKKAGYETITFNDLILYLNGFKTLPKKPLIITFDDGYRSNYQYAYPILKEMKMKAVISIIGWSVGRDRTNDGQAIIPHFSWEEAKEMVNSGVIEIQNHTFDLHSPAGKSVGYGKDVGLGVTKMKGETENEYYTRLKEDLMKNNIEIYMHTGKMPTMIVYPYGAYSKETEMNVAQMGFVGSVTTKPGVRTYDDLSDLKDIPRINVTETLKGYALLKTLQ